MIMMKVMMTIVMIIMIPPLPQSLPSIVLSNSHNLSILKWNEIDDDDDDNGDFICDDDDHADDYDNDDNDGDLIWFEINFWSWTEMRLIIMNDFTSDDNGGCDEHKT